MLNMLVETLISSAGSSYSHPDSFLSKEAIQAWAGAQAQYGATSVDVMERLYEITIT